MSKTNWINLPVFSSCEEPVCLGWNDELEGYVFKVGQWKTLSQSLVDGYQVYVLEKAGEYILVDSELAGVLTFIKEHPFWKIVARFPSHHEVIDGPEFGDTHKFYNEYMSWYNQLPLPESSDCLEEDYEKAMKKFLGLS